MNVKNNKRRRESRTKIEKAFVNMILTKSINKISVTDICKETGLNRTTFYANYVDIYDLADKIREEIEDIFSKAFTHEETRTPLNFFKVIYDNQTMFKVYFKLAHDTERQNVGKNGNFYVSEYVKKFFNQEYTEYHVAFFEAGINAMIKLWLEKGCIESPEKMTAIIKSEYAGRNAYFTANE